MASPSVGPGFFFSLLSTFAALFFAIFFLPATRVRPGPAAFGALLTTVLSEVAKLGFAWYASGYAMGRYSGIYGAVATVPLFLIWIYWSWLMFLLGAEAAYAAQNIHLLESLERRGPQSLERDLLLHVNGPMAARLMIAVSSSYQRGGQALARTSLRDTFDLSDEALNALVRRLKERSLLTEVESGPASLPAESTTGRNHSQPDTECISQRRRHGADYTGNFPTRRAPRTAAVRNRRTDRIHHPG